jgi:hypothetical protein
LIEQHRIERDGAGVARLVASAAAVVDHHCAKAETVAVEGDAARQRCSNLAERRVGPICPKVVARLGLELGHELEGTRHELEQGLGQGRVTAGGAHQNDGGSRARQRYRAQRRYEHVGGQQHQRAPRRWRSRQQPG